MNNFQICAQQFTLALLHNVFFNKYKAGFLPGHSTMYQILETYHSIVEIIDNSKAFDIV
jgi:hypothetical protein